VSFVKAIKMVRTATGVVTAEASAQAGIAAAGGTAEAVSTGFMGSGLTAGTGVGLVGAALVGGVALGNVAREDLIPDSANETYGEVLKTATDFYGVSDAIANVAEWVDKVLP
jgi:hypothetical protein